MKKLLLTFAIALLTALCAVGQTMVADCENGRATQLGTVWYGYVSGESTIKVGSAQIMKDGKPFIMSNPGANGTDSAVVVNGRLEGAESAYESAGIGFAFTSVEPILDASDMVTNVADVTYDIIGAAGITFYHKGAAINFCVITTDTKQNAGYDYTYQVTEHDDWTLVEFLFADAVQESWVGGEFVKPFDPTKVMRLQWEVKDEKARDFEFGIDEVKLLGAQIFTYITTEGYELEFRINKDETTVACEGLTDKSTAGSADLVIPSTVTNDGITYSVTTIGESAFSGCSDLTGSLIIPNSVTSIGNYAFEACANLTEIEVNSSNANYSSIDGILYNKAQDTLITCPAGFIGELTIPNSVTTIKERTFFDCDGLIGVTIPSSVTNIEPAAFGDCSGLRRIINHSTYPQELDNYSEAAGQTHAFGGVEMDSVVLYVPEVSIIAYNVATIWKKFKNIEVAPTVKPIENITIDLDSAFNQIDLLDYFTVQDDSEIEFIVQSDNPEVVTVTMNGNKFGVIPISVGKTNISISAKSEYGIESQVDFTVTVIDEKGISSGCVSFTVIENIIPVKCPGDETGSISLQVSGNTAPYKFRWSTTQTGNEINELIAGKYSVVIRDSLGCAEIKTYEVEGPDFINIEQTLTKPDCRQDNGSIEVNVKGGTAPYSYNWNSGESSPTISDLSSGIYVLTVKDSRKCEYKKTIILDSKVSIEITVDSSKNTKCSSSEKGEIHVSVSGGTAPYSYNWADGGVGYNRTNLDEGIYNLVVTDDKGCTANLSHEIQSTSFLTPAIGLVSVDKLTDNNLIIWQKEETNEIDFYNIYRENPQTKEFEVVGTWDYENIGVFEDLEANTFERSWRYRLQAENDCGDRSKLSKSFKTIHMKSVELTEEGVALTWDDYEGEVYPTYAIHRVFGSEAVLEARVPFHTSYYFDANPPKEVTSYFVAVELPEEFVVEGNRLKAESGPFILAVSNIAEVEINAGGGNDDETSLNSVLNQILVYPTVANEKVNVAVGAGQQAQVSLYTLTGEKVYEQEVLETAELNVSSMPKGVYTVVVTIDGVGYGYKIIVND